MAPIHDRLPGAVLGLDGGMTATRASIVPFAYKGDTTYEPRSVRRPNDIEGSHLYTDFDFPATAFPFRIDDPPSQCIGFAAVSHDKPFPLKMFCLFKHTQSLYSRNYRAVGEKWKRRAPQIKQMWADLKKKNDAEVENRIIQHLEDIYVEHLKIVRNSSLRTADNMNCQITKLALTIPSEWEKEMMDIYLTLLRRVWVDIAEENIEFIFESEAMGHWMFRLNNRYRLGEASNKVILADFGGHTLNVTVLCVNRPSGPGGEYSFCTDGHANCMYGGSEFHSCLVREAIGKWVEKQTPPLTPAESQHLVEDMMDCYRSKHQRKINGKSFFLEGKKGPGIHEKHMSISFDENAAKVFYANSFLEPIRNLNRILRRYQSDATGHMVDVLLSGGSFQNKFIYKQISTTIEAFGFNDKSSWITTMGPSTSRSSLVSQGAALAVVNTLDVRTFFNKAVFAMDWSKGKDNDLPVILFRNNNQPQRFEAIPSKKGFQPSIVCAPLSLSDASSIKIPAIQTYEFYTLDLKLKGSYEVDTRATFDQSHGDRLILSMRRLDADSENSAFDIKLPVYYDPGGCVCFVDVDSIRKESSGADAASTASTHRMNAANRRERSSRAMKARSKNQDNDPLSTPSETEQGVPEFNSATRSNYEHSSVISTPRTTKRKRATEEDPDWASSYRGPSRSHGQRGRQTRSQASTRDEFQKLPGVVRRTSRTRNCKGPATPTPPQQRYHPDAAQLQQNGYARRPSTGSTFDDSSGYPLIDEPARPPDHVPQRSNKAAKAGPSQTPRSSLPNTDPGSDDSEGDLYIPPHLKRTAKRVPLRKRMQAERATAADERAREQTAIPNMLPFPPNVVNSQPGIAPIAQM